MIELRDISKVYKETDSPVKAVGNVNLSIDTGCLVLSDGPEVENQLC